MSSKYFSKILAMATITLASVNSYAESEVGVLGGLNLGFSNASVSGTGITTGSMSGFMFGATYYQSLSEMIGLELGAFYQPMGASFTVLSTTTDVSVKYLSVPLMVRFQVLPKFLRVGLGGYFGLAVSDVTAGALTATRSASNWSDTDFGLIGSVRGAYEVAANVDLVADVRYMLGLTDVNTTAATDSKLRNLSFLVGASYKF